MELSLFKQMVMAAPNAMAVFRCQAGASYDLILSNPAFSNTLVIDFSNTTLPCPLAELVLQHPDNSLLNHIIESLESHISKTQWDDNYIDQQQNVQLCFYRISEEYWGLQIYVSVEKNEDYHQVKFALTKEKQRLEDIIESANIGTWEWDLQNNRVDINLLYTEMLGYSIEEFHALGSNAWEKLIHPEDNERVRKKLQQHFMQEEAFFETNMRIKHKQGHWVWILDKGTVLKRNEIGQPVLMLGTHQDITALKQVENQLRHLFSFSELVAELNSAFAYVNEDNLDDKLNDMLQRVGAFFEMDRCYLFRYSSDMRFMTNTHEYCKPGVHTRTVDYQ